MKYKYFFDVLQCNRFYSDFMRACDLDMNDVGIEGTVSFISDAEPTKETIKKIETLLDSTKDEKSLEYYYRNTTFIRVEVIPIGENDE